MSPRGDAAVATTSPPSSRRVIPSLYTAKSFPPGETAAPHIRVHRDERSQPLGDFGLRSQRQCGRRPDRRQPERVAEAGEHLSPDVLKVAGRQPGSVVEVRPDEGPIPRLPTLPEGD